jgi:hypothetical protein
MQNIINKFKFKGLGMVINSPEHFVKEFVKLNFKTSFDNKAKSSNTLVFINNNEEYLYFLKNNLKKIEEDSMLWLAYPKSSSKIKTNINRDTIRITGEEYGITTVSIISIDDTWSALRFRPIKNVGK